MHNDVRGSNARYGVCMDEQYRQFIIILAASSWGDGNEMQRVTYSCISGPILISVVRIAQHLHMYEVAVFGCLAVVPCGIHNHGTSFRIAQCDSTWDMEIDMHKHTKYAYAHTHIPCIGMCPSQSHNLHSASCSCSGTPCMRTCGLCECVNVCVCVSV